LPNAVKTFYTTITRGWMTEMVRPYSPHIESYNLRSSRLGIQPNDVKETLSLRQRTYFMRSTEEFTVLSQFLCGYKRTL